jgi:PAS domain S-box-containing protein
VNLRLFQRRSLRARVTLFALVIFLAGIWALAFYASAMLRHDLLELVSAQQRSTAAYVAAGVDQELEERLRGLEKVAARVTPAMMGNALALQAFLQDRPLLSTLFNAGILVHGPEGVAIAEVPLSGRVGLDYMGIGVMAAALREGKSGVSAPILGKRNQVPLLGLVAPVRDAAGRVIGALSGVISLGEPNFLDKLTQSRYGRTGGHLLVAPRERLIVTATDKRRIMEVLPAPGVSPMIDRLVGGYEGSGVFVNPMGVEVLQSSSRVPVAGWYVGVQLPTEEAFAPIAAMQRNMLLAAACLTLLAGALTWWMLRRQLAPIAAAARSLSALSNVDEPLRPLAYVRQDEVGDLIGGFNRLLETLGQREAALKGSEARHRAITQSAHDAIITSDSAGLIVSWNRGAESMFGYSETEAVGQPMTRLMPARYHCAHLAGMHRIGIGAERRRAGEARELVGLRRDGSEFALEISIARWDAGNSWFVTGIVRDISARKKAQDAVSEQDDIHRSVLATSIDGYCMTDLQGRLLEVNDAYARLSGYAREELLGMRFAELDATASEQDIAARIQRCFAAGGDLFEAMHRKKDGSLWQVEINMHYGPAAGGRVFAFVRDIHQRKRIQGLKKMQLGFSEVMLHGSLDELLRAVLDAAEMLTSSRIGFFHFVDPDQEHIRLQTWSTNTQAHMCRAQGKGRHYPLSQAGVWVDCVKARKPVIHNDYAGLEHKRGLPEGHAAVTRELTVPVIRAGLVVAIIGVGNKPGLYTEDDEATVVELANMAIELIESKRAQVAVGESERYLSAVFQASPVGIVVSKCADGRTLDINESALRLYGYAREEMLGRTLDDLGVHADPAQNGEMLRLLRELGAVDRVQMDFCKRDGELGVMEVSCRLIDLHGEQHLLAMIVDVTERRRVDEALRQAQKLESLGTLAGGIAHDFNNILAAIRGNADLAAEDVGPDHAAAESLAEIRKASARASELVRRIAVFGRPKKTEQTVVDLGAVVGEVLKLLRATLPAGIALQSEFARDTPLVQADEAQVHEAVVNLTTNAAYAIGARAGTIVYRLEPVQVRAKLAASISGLSEGRYARLTVTDSGCGMDGAARGRIFDAFYTTKPVGEGTGLGLAMVRGIMQGHAGAVTVASAKGKGTSFALYFPAAQAAAQRQPPAAPAQIVLSAGQRVLYVDDEEALVFLVDRALTRLGHQVSAFADPERALAAFRAHPERYDVVVTDHAMPRMSGIELARAVRVLRPAMPVLLLSGHIEAKDEENARAAGIGELMLKPVGAEELARTLERMCCSAEPARREAA